VQLSCAWHVELTDCIQDLSALVAEYSLQQVCGTMQMASVITDDCTAMPADGAALDPLPLAAFNVEGIWKLYCSNANGELPDSPPHLHPLSVICHLFGAHYDFALFMHLP